MSDRERAFGLECGSEIKGPGGAQTPRGMASTEWTGADMPEHISVPPSFFAAEARIFANAAIRMLEEGEPAQACALFLRAAKFAADAA